MICKASSQDLMYKVTFCAFDLYEVLGHAFPLFLGLIQWAEVHEMFNKMLNSCLQLCVPHSRSGYNSCFVMFSAPSILPFAAGNASGLIIRKYNNPSNTMPIQVITLTF